MFNDHTGATIDHRPVFSMRSMVLFKHIDYNNSCTGVFRMRLMVIDVYIDEALGILGRFTLKRVHAEDAGGSGQKTGVGTICKTCR